MKILVTGATGFVGNYVVKELLQNGHTVIASSLDPAKAKTKSWIKKVDYIPFDLSTFDNSENYFSFFHEPEAMIHLAWE